MITLAVLCLQTLEPPQYVYWYHNDKIINYDTKRTRVSFDLGESKQIPEKKNKLTKIGENTKKTSSRLVIEKIQKSDSGNYTCRSG